MQLIKLKVVFLVVDEIYDKTQKNSKKTNCMKQSAQYKKAY